MIVYGYVLDSRYEASGEFMMKVRIPAIHGPMNQKDYRGQRVRNYVPDSEIPFYSSLILPHEPAFGDVVAIATTGDSSSNWLVLGYTGGSFAKSLL